MTAQHQVYRRTEHLNRLEVADHAPSIAAATNPYQPGREYIPVKDGRGVVHWLLICWLTETRVEDGMLILDGTTCAIAGREPGTFSGFINAWGVYTGRKGSELRTAPA